MYQNSPYGVVSNTYNSNNALIINVDKMIPLIIILDVWSDVKEI